MPVLRIIQILSLFIIAMGTARQGGAAVTLVGGSWCDVNCSHHQCFGSNAECEEVGPGESPCYDTYGSGPCSNCLFQLECYSSQGPCNQGQTAGYCKGAGDSIPENLTAGHGY
jgi:hypothetical protein